MTPGLVTADDAFTDVHTVYTAVYNVHTCIFICVCTIANTYVSVSI